MIRLGAVSYLNTRPLVHGLERETERFSVRFDVPAKCAELLHGNEEALYGDSAYHSKAAEELAIAVGLSFFVCKRGSRGHPLSERERLRNRRYSRVRAIGEHPYLVVKRLWGHTKVRYRGIAKNLAQMHTLFALANLYRVRHRLMTT